MADPPRHGDVWLARLDKLRPVLVITRDPYAARLTHVTVVPITSTIRGTAGEVEVGPAEGLVRASVANCDAATTIPAASLQRRLGTLGVGRVDELCDTLAATFSCGR